MRQYTAHPPAGAGGQAACQLLAPLMASANPAATASTVYTMPVLYAPVRQANGTVASGVRTDNGRLVATAAGAWTNPGMQAVLPAGATAATFQRAQVVQQDVAAYNPNMRPGMPLCAPSGPRTVQSHTVMPGYRAPSRMSAPPVSQPIVIASPQAFHAGPAQPMYIAYSAVPQQPNMISAQFHMQQQLQQQQQAVQLSQLSQSRIQTAVGLPARPASMPSSPSIPQLRRIQPTSGRTSPSTLGTSIDTQPAERSSKLQKLTTNDANGVVPSRLLNSTSVSSFSSCAFEQLESSSEMSQGGEWNVLQDHENGIETEEEDRPSIEPGSTGWSDVTVSILLQIAAKLEVNESKHLRLVCRHWRETIDNNLSSLAPASLMSRHITQRFPNVKELHLMSCRNVRNRDLHLLSAGSLKLHTLTLGDDAHRPWVSNIGLAHVSKLKTLTELNLQDCTQLTNRGLLALSQLTQLKSLSLKRCNKLNNMGLEALRENMALTSLNICGCVRVSDKGLQPLTALTNLAHLRLGSTRIRDGGCEYLAQMTSLQELRFMGESITNAGILQLTTLTGLHTLALRDCTQVTGEGLSQLLQKLTGLKSLDLFKVHAFDDAQLSKCMPAMSGITALDLRGTVVSEHSIAQLATLKGLKTLKLAPRSEICLEEQLGSVSVLTQLTSLAINSCRLVSQQLTASFVNLKELEELDLSSSGQTTLQASDVAVVQEPVPDAVIKAMCQLTNLTSLNLSRRSVHEVQVRALAAHLPKLQKMCLEGCPLHPDSWRCLQRAFTHVTFAQKYCQGTTGPKVSEEHRFL